MKISEAKIEIERAINAKTPIFLWGPPGVGKSSCIEQIAIKNGIDYIDLRTCNMDVVDIRGLPEAHGEDGYRVTKWIRPEFIPANGKGILFLDELPQAPVSIMNGLSELVLNRRIGNHKLGDDWSIVAAGNRMGDRAATNRLPSHIASRFSHIQLDLDENEWYLWATSSNVRYEIVAFLRLRPKLLSTFSNGKDKSEIKIYNSTETDYAFACPRSWEFLSRLMDSASGRPHIELISGTIGNGAAAEFWNFLSLIDKLPDIDYIIQNPEKVEVPKESGILYAVVEALGRKVTIKNFNNIMLFLERIPAEYKSLAILQMKIQEPAIQETEKFIDWAIKNATIMV